MTEPARKLEPIQPIPDADLDDPDTALVEALRDSDRPERVMRARRMAATKLDRATERLRRRQSDPPR